MFLGAVPGHVVVADPLQSFDQAGDEDVEPRVLGFGSE
jgi:hypothetical protein